MDVTVKILRFDPAKDASAHWESYTVDMFFPRTGFWTR
jgi:succinate dehydrogenase/fumarate reductase-like Fe-S protein